MSDSKARFAHVNIVAKDWQSLAAFYVQVFGCEPVPPERSLEGSWLDRATGVCGARIRGIHLRLPGYGEDGPTLEIFEYSKLQERGPVAANRQGLGHLAFAVEDVEAARDRVRSAGGQDIGHLVSRKISGAGQITFAYVTDPEGNIVELQHWAQVLGDTESSQMAGRGGSRFTDR